MTISYQVEPYEQCRADIELLLEGHYQEIARDKDVIPLDPDWQGYQQLAECGQLHIVTVREDGRVIGYHVTIVKPHLHYRSTLCGFFDLYYLIPEKRRGRIGMEMFAVVEQTLKQRGVVKLFTGTKVYFNVGALFKHMDWVETEALYTKVINRAADAGDSSVTRGC